MTARKRAVSEGRYRLVPPFLVSGGIPGMVGAPAECIAVDDGGNRTRSDGKPTTVNREH